MNGLTSSPFLYSGENDVTKPLFPQKIVDKLVHIREVKYAISVHEAQFPVVVEQRLQVLVAVQRGVHQAQVKTPQGTQISKKVKVKL